MCASTKDPQEEKNQQKIEFFLEKNQQVILDRTHSLINIICILIGAYVVIFAAIFPKMGSMNTNSTVSDLERTSIFVSYMSLMISIAFIIIAVGLLWRSIYLGNKGLETKFTKRKCPVDSIQLKNGSELRIRNIDFFSNIIIQIKYNDKSIWCLLFSLLLFTAFIFFNIHTAASVIALGVFFLIILGLAFSLNKYYNNQETVGKQS